MVTPGDGQEQRRIDAPQDWSMVDFSLHASGDITAVLTRQGAVRLWRLSALGTTKHDEPFTDVMVASDPDYGVIGAVDRDALQPVSTRDAARVFALGEDLLLVLRTGLNAVVAYRLNYGDSGYVRAWRTLVEPGGDVGRRFLTSGSHDVFDQLVNHAQFRADLAADGTLAIGVVNANNTVFEGHTWHFGEAITAAYGAIVTRIAPDGGRLGSSVVATPQLSELHGLRAVPGGFMVVGRVRTARLPDGSGWNAFVGRLGVDGSVGELQVVDVDRGDIVFDVAALPQGGYLAVGSTGWTQNPAGASISEDAAPLLVTLATDGRLRQRLEVPAGPRNNQLRTLAHHGGRWLIGGQRNGPGTHSGDADASLIRADGFVIRAPDFD